MTRLFLHGLDSSGYGTKGRYFAEHFPDMLRPNFTGSLSERMVELHEIVQDLEEIIIVGSSFGGLMGACLSMDAPEKIKRLIMLAPALNFQEFSPGPNKVSVEAQLIIGKDDVVTPPDIVIPAAKQTFEKLEIDLVDDDHLLHRHFYKMKWSQLLEEESSLS